MQKHDIPKANYAHGKNNISLLKFVPILVIGIVLLVVLLTVPIVNDHPLAGFTKINDRFNSIQNNTQDVETDDKDLNKFLDDIKELQ